MTENKKNIIRIDLAEKVHKEIGLPVTEASSIVDIVFDKITESLVKKEEAKIKNFGTFKINHKKPRIGRNPKTKEEKVISERDVTTFHPSKNLKHKLNKK